MLVRRGLYTTNITHICSAEEKALAWTNVGNDVNDRDGVATRVGSVQGSQSAGTSQALFGTGMLTDHAEKSRMDSEGATALVVLTRYCTAVFVPLTK